MSRQLFYLLARAFREEGLPGLLPRKRGPKRARKGTDVILAYVAGRRAASPGCPTRELVDDVSRALGVRLHRRTLERGLVRLGLAAGQGCPGAGAFRTARFLRAMGT